MALVTAADLLVLGLVGQEHLLGRATKAVRAAPPGEYRQRLLVNLGAPSHGLWTWPRHDQQLVAAGVSDDAVKLTALLQWQTLRVAGPLRLIAQDVSTGPIPLAAAHGAEGLQKLLGVVAADQVPSMEQAKQHVAATEAARECFMHAIGNMDILLDRLGYRFARFADLGDQRFLARRSPRRLHRRLRGAGGDRPEQGEHQEDHHAVAGHAPRRRVAGHHRAYELLRMFARQGHPTPLGQAFAAYGRIDKTMHLLSMLDPIDSTYRRSLGKQLSVQESWPRLARKICHGNSGRIRQA